jgi:hypothetical protein
MTRDFRLTPEERIQMDRDGFVVRHNVFSRDECRQMADAVEAMVQDLLAVKREQKETVGGYVFEWQRDLAAIVKWEADHPDVVLGVEPFAHLSKPLKDWAHDPRFVDPSKDFVGQDDISLYTEKVTMKRAHTGGSIFLHQDYPYWKLETPCADKVVTALLYLDDATIENGCLEVAPGSHKEGERAGKEVEGFGRNEMDPSQFDTSRLIPVEAKAGTVVYFGAFLVHRSLPNRTANDRRTLLYSYQPAGHLSALEFIQKQLARAPADGNALLGY